MMHAEILKAAALLKRAKYVVVMTGAGISVESGIPSFRGEEGIWKRYDPIVLDLDYFFKHPQASWAAIKTLFYDFFGEARANPAHVALAELERAGIVKSIITQNIDNLHTEAGSKQVYEYHGNTRTLSCTVCHRIYSREQVDLTAPIPRCPKDHGILKPNFVFFGEGIPEREAVLAHQEACRCDVMLIIGTTGEVRPACNLPRIAKQNHAKIIEINIENSLYTLEKVSDIFLQGKATTMMQALKHAILDKAE
jgi:NAD-dependent deacetylase